MIQQTAGNGKKRNRTSFYLYCSPNLPLPREYWWAGAYISNVIHFGTTVRPDYRQGVPINMAWLKKMLGRKAQPTIGFMLENEIIARDGGYTLGESSYHYRLVPPYDQCQRIECTDRQLIGRPA